MKNKMTTRQILAQNIKKARLNKNLSQEVLAELSGLHRTYIGSVERGERNISIDNIERIANALNTTVINLFMEKIDVF